jgi:hypothetical protein
VFFGSFVFIFFFLFFCYSFFFFYKTFNNCIFIGNKLPSADVCDYSTAERGGAIMMATKVEPSEKQWSLIVRDWFEN